MEIEAEFTCVYCGEANVILVDPSAGAVQETIEDCQVCCRPNRLRIECNPEAGEARAEAEEA